VKAKKQVTTRRLYKYIGSPNLWFVKLGEYAWGVYRFYVRRASADKACRNLMLNHPSQRARLSPTPGQWRARVVKTSRGWAVVQLGNKGYRTKSTDPNLYPWWQHPGKRGR